MQRQSDILQVQVRRPECVETTALGVAYMAGLAVGYWSGLDELKSNLKGHTLFVPKASKEQAKKDIAGWNRAVRCAIAWAEDEGNE